MPIRILDAATVGRIAAGEVVERPASVVKELVENALDAGATSVTVEIRGGGIDYLRVTDNGCGIPPEQIRLAFENHATSKLSNADQLDDIRTLGFRGEALPSIAAVSRIELCSRATGQDSGMRYTCEGGQNIRLIEDGCPQGTTIIMRDLFFNVPVRRAFLKKASYEGGLVGDMAARLLLGNPGISMRFISGGSTLYHSFGDGKLRNAVFAVYGRETAENMKPIDAFEGGTRITGLIGTGELAKSTRAHQLFYINGRAVRCPLMSRALEEVCRSRVTIGLYPMCVLNLILPANAVDINVHPSKLEVRFRDEDMMRATCVKLLSSAFEGERVLDIDALKAQRTAVNTEKVVREVSRVMPAVTSIVPTAGALREDPAERLIGAAVKTVQLRPRRGDGEVAEPPARPRVEPVAPPRPVVAMPTVVETPAAVKADSKPPTVIRKKPEAPAEQTALPPEALGASKETPYRIIGTAFKTYILVEAGDMLLLIDQHAAHERIQYERLMARALDGTASQQLLIPEIIRLSAREMAVVEDNLDVLSDAGYVVEPFGDSDIRILAVPFVLGRAETKPLFLEMLTSLSRLKAATVDARRSEVMQMACKSAVKAGDPLTDGEIDALIREMLTTGAPSTCPHGRPVVKSLTRRELEKMFKRIQ